MRLSWNEVRVRSASFAQEWWNTVRERSETQSFYNDFFEIFGVKRRSVARYEQHVKKLDNRSGFIDLFWPGVLIVEQKSRRTRSVPSCLTTINLAGRIASIVLLPKLNCCLN